jgi:hypothetical protein
LRKENPPKLLFCSVKAGDGSAEAAEAEAGTQADSSQLGALSH